MNTTADEWDTHAANPYVSEYVKPFNNRKQGEEYTYDDLCYETFALIMWKLQEEHHLDYESAFLLATKWRRLSEKRLSKLLGKDISELYDREEELWHGRLFKIMEKGLPQRNLPEWTPLDFDWKEDDPYFFI